MLDFIILMVQIFYKASVLIYFSAAAELHLLAEACLWICHHIKSL